MRSRLFLFLFLCASLSALSGCQQSGQMQANRVSAEAKTYELSGKVISVDKAKKKAKIEHEEIKGYMPGMTMDFPIKQDWVLDELKPGNHIGAKLVVDKNGDYWLEEIGIVSNLQSMEGVEEQPTEAPSNKIGAEVPDFKLTNQDGKRFGFKDYRGKNLVVTFIFTRCPDADMCPRMSIQFSDLEKQLRGTPLAENTRLLSVSFDPEYDKPEILRNYAAGYFGKDVKPDFTIWQLATGTKEEVNQVKEFFGVVATSEGAESRIIHNLRTIVIGADGKIKKIYAGNNWKTSDILRDLQTSAT